jgi:hypothetical protein
MEEIEMGEDKKYLHNLVGKATRKWPLQNLING